MGQGGFINLLNGTPYPWVRYKQEAYQMAQWDFPVTIQPNTTASVYVEWSERAFKRKQDDSAEAYYTLENAPSGQNFTFQIRARWDHDVSKNGDFSLQAYYDGLSTPGFNKGGVNKLGWVHDGHVNFVLGGAPFNAGYGTSGFWTTHDPASSWMWRYLPMIGTRPLKDIVMPGSHDSGMSIVNGKTKLSEPCQILTQTQGIGTQLARGARFFDVRPVINGGKYKTGHYSDVSTVGTEGGNGQAIDDIITEINDFTRSNNELIILDLWQDLDTDAKSSIYPRFNSTQWKGLLDKLLKLERRWTGGNQSVDLNTVPLNTFLLPEGGHPQSAVLLIFEPTVPGLANYNGQGYFASSSWPHKGFYADKNDPNEMIKHQLRELDGKNASQSFIQYWTLTQQNSDVLTCVFDPSRSVINLAKKARPSLFQTLYPYAVKKSLSPGILLTDDAGKSDELVALAMALNFKIPS